MRDSSNFKFDSLPLNRILQGDCVEILRKMPSECVDLIFADPPYFMQTSGALTRPSGAVFSGCDDLWDAFSSHAEYCAFSRAWLAEARRVLKPNGSIWIIGSMQCIYALGAIMQDLGLWLINDVVWQKSNPTPNFHGTRLNNAHETLIWAAKSKKSRFVFHYKTAKELNCEVADFENGARRQLGSVWKMPVCSGAERLRDEGGAKLHNTQKPLALLYRVIAISSNVGDLVLDPFGGTMTSAVAAKILGRKFITIEQNAKYAAHGAARIEAARFENSAIARAEFDKKPRRVSLKEMIERGFLRVGEAFYLDSRENFEAILREDGKLSWRGGNFDIHTLCAKLKNAHAARLNGFKFWRVIRNGEKVLLENVREECRAVL